MPHTTRSDRSARRLAAFGRPGWILLLLIFGSAFTAAGDDRDVIFNEILYNPPGGGDALQFVELFNRGLTESDLSSWAFTKGIKFTFPMGTKIAPQSYIVVARDTAAFTAHYGPQLPVLGPFEGRLSHKGETIELSNAAGEAIDTLAYSDEGAWPTGADGHSSSLERICPFGETGAPENWAASNLPEFKRAAGTPGARNDNYSANRPPAILSVQFTPNCPSPREGVQVTAQIADIDGLESVSLLYRVAGTARESGETKIPMTRKSGDDKRGVYQATIGAQPHGQLVRFRVLAVDRAGTERVHPSPNEPRPTHSYFSYANTVEARIPIGHLVNMAPPARGPGHYERAPARRAPAPSPTRHNGAFLYVPADKGEPETFDYVKIAGRHGGYKVHFQKDRTLKGMTGINLISEGPMRWVLAEPLAYVVYRMAGVPSPLTEHVRLSIDGRFAGFHLLVEQPNESFLERNGRKTEGNLYKLIWYGQGIVGQHEKKTNLETGHDDLIQLLNGLTRTSGAEQWAFIQEHFNVPEVVNYYVVNMCIQNWDGFFNNYYTFHDLGDTGKWEIYPWDEDKTWGDYDGASSRYDWYSMPLTYGSNQGRAPGGFFQFGGGSSGGGNWWRPPGHFSGPLLANPEFRRRFLIRLREVCLTTFTEESLYPIIDAMEQRLMPEIRLQAQASNHDPQRALREFTGYMQSFRAQVQNRRKFLLAELSKIR